jgi:hypothetical protein
MTGKSSCPLNVGIGEVPNRGMARVAQERPGGLLQEGVASLAELRLQNLMRQNPQFDNHSKSRSACR